LGGRRTGAVDGTETGAGIRVSDPSDRFEREAVATADQVMSAPAGPAPQAAPAPQVVQRQEDDGDDEVQTFVQREEAAEEEQEDAGEE
jgi:hypothetical protein